jgi:hypothetical protein
MRPRRPFAGVFFMAALLSLPVLAAVSRAAAAGVTQLRSLTGEVELRRAKGGPGAAAPTPGPLFRRDELQTHKGTATVDLASGMELTLGPDSLFAVIGGVGSVDGFLARGTLTVAAHRGEASLVQVSTTLGRIDFRASEGRLEASAGRVLVQVIAGTAEVVVRQQHQALAAGQELELRAGGTFTEPRPIAPAAPVPVAATQPTEAPAPVEAVVAATKSPPSSSPAGPSAGATPSGDVPTGATSPLPAAPPPPPGPVAAAAPAPVIAAARPVIPPPPPPKKEPFFGFTTLRLLREKNIISQAEFDSAMRDLHEAVGPRGADSTTVVLGKWATTLFGFVQGDIIWDSTQSFNDFGSNFQVARPGTYAAEHSRLQGSIRDSRIGVRVQTPELPWLRASALFELDLLGPTGNIGSTITENSFFVNPNLRVRHAYFKVETPIVDVVFGQTWHLFGWQPNYIPAVVQWAGIVGELFARTMQLRISKTIKTRPVTIEMAIAGMRPPERDSSFPEFEAGFRLAFNKWTGVHTSYLTSTATVPASIGVSGDLRRYTLPEFAAAPQTTNSQLGLGIAVNAFIPIIPATKERKGNSLSILGEYVTGQGINDLYTGLNGGVANPSLPSTMGTPPTYASGVDAGLAVYDINGQLQLPRWTTFVVSLEYYLPRVGGRVGLFANVSRSQLHDSQLYANPARVRDNEIFYNGGFFVDITEAIRVGFDYARFDDQYADGVHAINDAFQMSGFLFF